MRAVVFAYHDVGARCLATLLAHGIEVPLVVTHQDAPDENIWFESVAELARRYGIETMTPASAGDTSLHARVRGLAPDFLFSFYYRSMLPRTLLEAASRGAYNLHGSLLPKYRGRAPVNWAVLHGERETGATLHVMVDKPDAGAIVDQQRVPILPNDTAQDVFTKVTVAAELVLDRALGPLITGNAPHRPQSEAGSYFGGRKPEDGRIDWTRPAREVHNLVRAVAPPYPGAFSSLRGAVLRIDRTFFRDRVTDDRGAPALMLARNALELRCADGGLLDVLAARYAESPLTPENFTRLLGATTVPLA